MRELFQPENKEDRINRAARYMGLKTPCEDINKPLVEGLLKHAEDAAIRVFRDNYLRLNSR